MASGSGGSLIYMAAIGLAVVAATGALARGGPAAISLVAPGQLHEDHAKFHCTDCHRPFRGVQPVGCQTAECHPAASLKKAEPPVAALHEAPGAKDCRKCHREHLGAAGAITVAFHVGASQKDQAPCSDCHGSEAQKAHPDIAEERCALCHQTTRTWQDAKFDHKGPGGEACSKCHGAEGKKAHPEIKEERCGVCHQSTKDWKQVSFDHKGTLAQEPCTACHPVPSGALHQVAGNNCQSCHGTDAWKPARFEHKELAAGVRQDCARCHGAQGRRAHAGITSRQCAACHTSTANWKQVNFNHGNVSGQACTSCHATPRGGFHQSARGMACSQCHTTRAWRPSTFRHDPFFVDDEHYGIACRTCHPTTFSQSTCERCHPGGVFDD